MKLIWMNGEQIDGPNYCRTVSKADIAGGRDKSFMVEAVLRAGDLIGRAN